MVDDMVRRARGSLIGLAIGDAIGSPTEGKTITQIRERWGRVTDFLSPDQSGTDDTEYALFSASLLSKHGRELTSKIVAERWRRDIISRDNRYKGAGFSEMMTIANLNAGLEPPLSGMHLHSWSDGLAMRAAPYGIAACGDPTLAASLTEIDGSVSHAGEGIYSGQAVAAAVAMSMTGAGVDEWVNAALAVIPRDCWTSRAILSAAEIARKSEDVWSALEPLYNHLACHYYYWSDVAPEAVSLAFGILIAARGEYVDSVLGAINIGRDTDTIAAIAGAITGASVGIDAIPNDWIEHVKEAKGTCIHAVAGVDIRCVADSLAEMAIKWSKDR
ncbi:ADP-ribosylglycohydrolase family protein [candidate division KSB1 bacterium]|nr:ADP-ribosylglycohydrolase family protein [candidate division KSB1 bacterium]